jgi:two-component system NtrC family response regulator
MQNRTTEHEPAKLLLVDDDPAILSQLRLAFDEEYRVLTADTPRDAWNVVQEERPDLITLDLGLERNDPESGFSLLEKCLQFDPLSKIILLTGNTAEEYALRAVEQGGFDFFSKPFDVEELRVLLRRALSVGRLERENVRLLEQLGNEGRLGSLLGRSPAMESVFKLIGRVAPADVSLLVLGESGTGKELVAREIRRLSPRATKPFISIGCGAIPEALLESELFGHEKGAYTGAHIARPGKLELADGGIVFLDEIGEMPISLQVKLLRFLQEHEVERVGGRSLINLDVRVIAATNRDLEGEVKAGRFREDLYYRLAVVNIKLPPLRERDEDVLYLAQYFLDRFCNELHRGRMTLSRSAKLAIQQYNWPGNVRELEHHMQRAVLLSDGRIVRPVDLELSLPGSLTTTPLRVVRAETDRQAVAAALRKTCGNISMAAEELEISRPTLHDLLRKHEIDASTFKGEVSMAQDGKAD